MPVRRPDAELTEAGTRYRAYRRRTEIEVLIGDGEIEDPAAEVWCYPKGLGADGAIRQAIAERS